MNRFMLLLIALFATPFASATELTLEFQTPAMMGGSIMGDDGFDWALVLFHDMPEASFALEVPSGSTYRNQSKMLVSEYVFGTGGVTKKTMPATEEAVPEALSAKLDFSGRTYASVFIQADRLVFGVSSAEATLKTATRGMPIENLMGGPEQMDTSHRQGAWTFESDGLGAVLSGRDSPLSFELEAEGLRVVEWHHGQASCGSSAPWCPDGGGSHSQGVDVGVASVAAGVLYYPQIEASSGSLIGSGQAVTILTGGPSVAMAVDGWMRLPLGSGAASCPEPDRCLRVEENTVRMQGNMTLRNLTVGGEEGLLRADVGGDVESAMLDERPTDPAALLGDTVSVVAAAAGAAIGLAVLAKLALGLFSRQHDPEVLLQHPGRQAIADLVQDQPGITFGEIRAHLGLSHGQTTHHLRVLGRTRVVLRRRLGRTTHFFLRAHGAVPLATVWPEPLQRLHAWLVENPGVRQGDVLDFAESAWGWGRSTSRNRLLRLVEVGGAESRADPADVRAKLYDAVGSKKPRSKPRGSGAA